MHELHAIVAPLVLYSMFCLIVVKFYIGGTGKTERVVLAVLLFLIFTAAATAKDYI